MSVATLIHVVPVERQWMAMPAFLKELLTYVGAVEVTVETFAESYEWDSEAETTARMYKLPIDQAVQFWERSEYPVGTFYSEYPSWLGKACQAFAEAELGSEPIEPNYFCLIAGPQSIGRDFEGTIAEVNFSIQTGAENTPESAEYFEKIVVRIQPLRELVEYVERTTRIRWEILVTYSV